MFLMGANVQCTPFEKLSSEVSPVATAYTAQSSARFLFNQLDLETCRDIYLEKIFKPLKKLLPIDGILRPMRIFLPCGTGSLCMAGAAFLQEQPEEFHELVAVSPFYDNTHSLQQLEMIAHINNRIKIHPLEYVSFDEALYMLRSISPKTELPFGMISSESLVAALRHLEHINPDQQIDLIPILTDGFVNSYLLDETNISQPDTQPSQLKM